jgi:hypothetical protein
MAYRRRVCTPRYLVPFFLICIFLSRIPEQPSLKPRQYQPPEQTADPDFVNLNFTRLALEIDTAHLVETSLAAVFPITQASFSSLRSTLSPFLGASSCVTKVLVVCPESLLLQSRAAIRQVVGSAFENINHPDVSLHPWSGEGDPTAVILQVAAHESTKWLLLLDETGLSGLSDRTRSMLLCPIAADLPVGPRGVIGAPGNRSCAPPSLETQPASYLLPPFTLPSSLVQEFHGDWSDLGHAVSRARRDQLGGVVRGYGDADANWCNSVCQHATFIRTDLLSGTNSLAPFVEDPVKTSRGNGLFIFLLPDLDDLHLVIQLLCRIYDAGYSIKILLYTERGPAYGVRETASSCHLQYETLAHEKLERHTYPKIYDWLDGLKPDIILTVTGADMQPITSDHATLVRIPREDLQHVHWMGSLTLMEWKSTALLSVLFIDSSRPDWNIPQIDISIITQDRPRSLARLFSSLSGGLFYGDSVNLRINMEQSSDSETIRMVGGYQWIHGSVFTHRRVIHGGLLPAVVESWYPHSDDSYGVLLEDDVELSPLFYAWIKMGILRYRSVEPHIGSWQYPSPAWKIRRG